LYHLHSALIQKVQFFQKCSSVEQSFFICHLKSVLFLPKDFIVKEGEQGDNLYFIRKGEVSVSISIIKDKSSRKFGKERNISSDEEDEEPNFLFDQSTLGCINILKGGALFGEVALLTKLKRTATI